MEQFFSEHFDAIVTLVLGFIGGKYSVNLFKKKDSNESNTLRDIDTGGGDFAGRDMNKNV